MKHGLGAWYGTKKDSYIGEWKMGKPDGYGVHKWYNGNNYFKVNKKICKNIKILKFKDLYLIFI